MKFLILLLSAAVIFLLWKDRQHAPRPEVDAASVLREIQELEELVTVRYSIQKVVGIREEKVPFGAESILLIAQARVSAGVDLGELKIDQVQLRDSSARVFLPKARVFDVALDEKETKVWDRSKTWWTPWVPYNPDLERQARLAAIESIRQAALDMGILEQARLSAEKSIRGLLRALGARDVKFLPQAS